MILGFILGKPMEDNLRRALTISDGSLSFLRERPLTLVIMIVTVLVLLSPLIRGILRPRITAPGEGG